MRKNAIAKDFYAFLIRETEYREQVMRRIAAARLELINRASSSKVEIDERMIDEYIMKNCESLRREAEESIGQMCAKIVDGRKLTRIFQIFGLWSFILSPVIVLAVNVFSEQLVSQEPNILLISESLIALLISMGLIIVSVILSYRSN